MTYEIISYAKAGPISFDMSEDEVKTILGNPIRISKHFLGTKRYIYDNMVVGFSQNSQTVRNITFTEEADVKIKDIDIFKDPNAFEKLIDIDGDPYEDVGIIVLMKLGVSLNDFRREEEKTLTAFGKGDFEDIKTTGNKFKL